MPAEQLARVGSSLMQSTLADLNLDAALVDEARMYQYRLARVQAELRLSDLDALITYDPINTRYATGIRNMQPWALHTIIRMGFIPAEGKAVVFEYAGSEHLGDSLDTIREVRPAISLQLGPGLSEAQRAGRLKLWADEVTGVARQACGDGNRIALDNNVPYLLTPVLENAGFELHGGYAVMARAMNVKNEDEIRAVRRSIEVAEIGISRMREALEPGISENELWSILNQTNVAFGGDYMDTRLLSSGPRTNPWYQESSDRPIEAGDMVALDTDMLGPYGYDADISRSFVCEVASATERQKTIYRIAYDHVQHNLALVRPGITFREMSEQAFRVPEPYCNQAIPMNWHGASLLGGWPNIVGHGYFDEHTEDGVLEPGMVLCVESYVGEPGGPDGVKLEEQVLVTEYGYRLLSHAPFESELLAAASPP